MQNRQHRTIMHRIQKLVGVPGRREWPRFRFAVAHDTGDDQIRVVEGGAVGVRDGVAQFAAFMDRAGGFWCHVARDTTRKRELLK